MGSLQFTRYIDLQIYKLIRAAIRLKTLIAINRTINTFNRD